jgi:hypothetical protein
MLEEAILIRTEQDYDLKFMPVDCLCLNIGVAINLIFAVLNCRQNAYNAIYRNRLNVVDQVQTYCIPIYFMQVVCRLTSEASAHNSLYIESYKDLCKISQNEN